MRWRSSLIYAASLGLWIVAAKPVQFYYHYLLPSMALLAGLALALDELWRARLAAGCRGLVLAGSVAAVRVVLPDPRPPPRSTDRARSSAGCGSRAGAS